MSRNVKAIDAEEFEQIAKAILNGENITLEELEDAVEYADAVPEMKTLIRSFCNGWKIIQQRLDRKTRVNGALKRQLEAQRQKAKGGGTDGKA